MPEILKNTGAKLWSLVDDFEVLRTTAFEELMGTGGKSDIRLIDEAIGKINENLNGYYFKIINDKLCICKDSESGTTSLPIAIIDDALSLTSDNAIQNKVVTEKFNSVEAKVNTNETTILLLNESINLKTSILYSNTIPDSEKQSINDYWQQEVI